MTLDYLGRALERTEEELRQERAYTLGRAADALESLLARLETLRQSLDEVPGPERAEKVAEYNRVREQARYRFWCIVVQREAIGLWQHEELQAAYRIPPPLSLASAEDATSGRPRPGRH